MPSKGKSVASAFDLKAEIARLKDQAKAGPSQSSEPDLKKKSSAWAKQNKGIKSRIERDIIELEKISQPTLDNARAALERKAALYDKLKRGKTGGLTDKQYDALLVDFDQHGDHDSDESSDEDNDHDDTSAEPLNDPIVEYEDEFGRVRSARRSEVPRHLLKQQEQDAPQDDDPYTIHGDQGYFPVYEPSAERVKEIEESALETDPATHYDSTREVRAKGAAFYQFSKDEETRKAQMEDLKRQREETIEERKREGADLPDPADEGQEDEAGGSKKAVRLQGKGVEKRKRELEERRKVIQDKRRRKNAEAQVDGFLADIEKDLR